MMRRLLKKNARLFVASNLLILVCSLVALIKPWLLGELFESYNKSQLSEFKGNLLILAAVLLLLSLLNYARLRVSDTLNQQLLADMRAHYFGHLLKLPLPFHEGHGVGDLLSSLNSDLSFVQGGLVGLPARLLQHGVTMLGGIYLLMTINYHLALVLVLVLPLLVIESKLLSRHGYVVAEAMQEQLGIINNISTGALGHIINIKAFNRQEATLDAYRAAYKKELQLAAASSRNQGFLAAIAGFLPAMTLLGVIAYGTLGAGQPLAAGQVVKFTLYGFYLNGALCGLCEVYGTYKRTSGAAGRIKKFLAEREESLTGTQVKKSSPLTIDNISFAYESRPTCQVIKDFSLTIAQGDKIWLQGPSGCGKSTLVKLLCGFYRPDKGRICLAGEELDIFSLKEWRDKIGLVTQETELFAGTIKDNILLGLDGADFTHIVSQVGLADLLEQLPRGGDTPVGEGGRQLSGGQRQRVALARALIKKPQLLILDEPTAALDNAAEAEIFATLQTVCAETTTLLICHHLPEKAMSEAGWRVVEMV